jgi:DNA-binding transcriptional regulator YiaG
MENTSELDNKPLTVGRALAAIRLETKTPPQEFAQILGISPSHLCNLEKGRKGISPERAKDFKLALENSKIKFSLLPLHLRAVF